MAKQKMTAAELIALYLEKRGVKHVYGVPGAAILPFYDAVKELTKIESYIVRHEQTVLSWLMVIQEQLVK